MKPSNGKYLLNKSDINNTEIINKNNINGENFIGFIKYVNKIICYFYKIDCINA